VRDDLLLARVPLAIVVALGLFAVVLTIIEASVASLILAGGPLAIIVTSALALIFACTC